MLLPNHPCLGQSRIGQRANHQFEVICPPYQTLIGCENFARKYRGLKLSKTHLVKNLPFYFFLPSFSRCFTTMHGHLGNFLCSIASNFELWISTASMLYLEKTRNPPKPQKITIFIPHIFHTKAFFFQGVLGWRANLPLEQICPPPLNHTYSTAGTRFFQFCLAENICKH